MPSALAAQVTAADLLARSVGEKVASKDDALRLCVDDGIDGGIVNRK